MWYQCYQRDKIIFADGTAVYQENPGDGLETTGNNKQRGGQSQNEYSKSNSRDFPDGPVVRNLCANAGDPSRIRSLIWAGRTCQKATKLVRCND